MTQTLLACVPELYTTMVRICYPTLFGRCLQVDYVNSFVSPGQHS
jgi:hypothetical protein